MQLPLALKEKIEKLYQGLNKKTLTETRENLTKKYKETTGKSQSLIESKTDSVLYAISRMPSTYAVIYTLVEELQKEGFLENISSVLDVGSGTGAGYFALKELGFEGDIELLERDKNMIEVFKKLEENQNVIQGDINSKDIKKSELVMASYVVSEMTESDRISATLKMLAASEKYLLLIDTGTPETYAEFMRLKELILKKGYKVVAPCICEKCPLENDYCQFYSRVERSSLQRISKSATLGFEDEKFFYMLISKDENLNFGQRVIRRPIIQTNSVKLSICSKDGVSVINLTKKDKELFKKAKKCKINEIL